ncbi:CopG family transcriptional regulator [Pseudomarimonas arenosa]|uniref:CopG family transcriptional regulator n=1 Tax=Pseudomarimonas arenosa TaxID=2774145 RepID=A0AAW3ZJR6_9GAMM|nr:CopG family transcriptional regulator [Pseudomarimonas arenosa]MBD8526231.1 CopG family transcriptional regulator [Pseudomarimonas arenosa]
MSIQRKPRVTDAKAEEFIAGAPDASEIPATYSKGIRKGNKRQISLTIAPELLRKVDEVAKRTGQGRAGIINMAIYRALEGDVFAS